VWFAVSSDSGLVTVRVTGAIATPSTLFSRNARAVRSSTSGLRSTLARNTSKPSERATSENPRATVEKNADEISVTIRPRVLVSPDTMARARLLGMYPRLSAAARTRSTVSRLAAPSPARTRPAVDLDTPATEATSRMVTRLRFPGINDSCKMAELDYRIIYRTRASAGWLAVDRDLYSLSLTVTCPQFAGKATGNRG
jgi:hypothetical protein